MSVYDLIQEFDVADYLSGFGKVSKTGPTNVTVNPCPICGDRHGKFYANVTGSKRNGLYNTYCCHNAGNLIDLVMRSEGCDRIEAEALIARSVDGGMLRLAPLIPRASQQPAVRIPSLPGPLSMATPGHPCWIKSRMGTVSERGVDDYIIARHGLMITGGNAMYAGVQREDLNHRLLIPVFTDYVRTLLSWQARDLTGLADRKYLFPSGDRSTEWLYDLQGHQGRTLLIVEGAPGKWAWDRLGRASGRPQIEHLAVASFGKKLTAAQIALIMNATHIEKIILGWDLDAAAEIVKVAGEMQGRKDVWVMPAHASGRDHDELTFREMEELLAASQRYTPQMGVELTTSLALGRFALKR